MSKMKIMEEIADVQVSSIIEILYESIGWAMDGVEEFDKLDSEAYNAVHGAIQTLTIEKLHAGYVPAEDYTN
jgi:hypothetical protein